MTGTESVRPTRPFSTIYARMLVPFAAALLLGTVVAWWMSTALLSRTLENRVSEQLFHAADVVSQRSFPVTEPVLARLNKLLRASVYLLSSDGSLLLYGDEAPPEDLRTALQERYRHWQTLATPKGKFHLSVDGRNYLLVLRQADRGRQSRYQAVAAFSDLSDVRLATRRGGLWLAALAFCGITLLALIGYRIARSITVPVAELAAMAGTIAGGNRSVRVDVHHRDEVGALAQSLNTMAEHLEHFEQQVVEQSRLATLGELSAKVAHEIRNPLTAIKMQLQLLEDELAEDAKPRLESVLDEVSRLELIVSSTLQLGRPNELQRQPADLNQLVSEVIRLLEPQLQHRQIDMQVELGKCLPPCLLDAGRVKQIMLNLMNNAADELSAGGVIRVRTALVQGDHLALEVADSGAGIPAGRRAQLFEHSISNKSTGFGLGLRVTRELVELHGGSIDVGESDLGGALFRVLFPLEI